MQGYTCGKLGHKGYEYPLKSNGKGEIKNETREKRAFKCFLCGDPTNKQIDCPFFYKNKMKESDNLSIEKLF